MPASPQATRSAALLYSIVKNGKRVIDARLRAIGLSAARVPLLIAIDNAGPMRQRALASSCELAPRTVTELVDSLERDGLVERRSDPGDRRAHEVHLTPAGRAILKKTHAVHAQVLEEVLDALGSARLSDFAGTLGDIDRRIRALLPGGAVDDVSACGLAPLERAAASPDSSNNETHQATGRQG